MNEITLISSKDLIKAGYLDFDNIISVIKKVFKDYHNGKVILPKKTTQIFDEKIGSRIDCMPSTVLSDEISGVKWISIFPNNPVAFGIPNISGVIILNEIKSGLPIAIMDAQIITAVRTAAVGAIGAMYLARKNSRICGFIGAGIEARMHFKFINHFFKIDRCFVASRTIKSENNFVEDMSKEYPSITFTPCRADYRKASKDADIIVTAVSCQEQLLKADSIKCGAYYCHVGGLEDEYDVALKANKIICDNWNALKHRGSPTIARLFKVGKLKDEDIYANLDEIILNLKKGREREDEFIYFNSIGLSFVDMAVANYFYKKIINLGLGEKFLI